MKAEWIDILVCPVTRTPLRWDHEAEELISDAAGLAYPIRNGTPVMLVELARRLTSESDIEAAQQ